MLLGKVLDACDGLRCRKCGECSRDSANDVAHADSLDGCRRWRRGSVADRAELSSELS